MIGERLEEARKRKGVSIREVAETTKIRGDYLLAMEDNSFDIPLPEIYIRGFLKNYARFLNMDANKVLTDYDAHLLGKTSRPSGSGVRSSNQNSLGRVEIPGDEEAPHSGDVPDDKAVITEAPEEEGPDPELTFSLKRESPATSAPQTRVLKRESSIMDQESWNENKTLYMKIGLVFMAIMLVSIILVVMVQMLGKKGDTPDINPELAATSSAQADSPVEPEPTGAIIESSGIDIITISATDSLTLIVEQTVDRKRLYSGTLIAGETLSLEKEGPVSIRFSSGAAMQIEKDGQQYNIPQTGMGRTVIE
jgi:transcriptional regulator with XRE-family HTH domain